MWQRFDFLLRFGGLALVLTLAIALGLSRVLAADENAREKQQIVFTSLGQVSAAMTPVLAKYNFRAPVTPGEYKEFDHIANDVQPFNPFLDAVRIYRTDGTAVYPRGSTSARSDVASAIKAQDVVLGPLHASAKGQDFTAYSPLSNVNGNGFAAVIALDFNNEALRASTENLQRFVFRVTWGASALIFVALGALALAAQRELNRRQRLADETFTQTMTGIASIVDKRDPYTAGHSKRVSEYAVALAHKMRAKERDVRTIEAAALLHDVGKIGIPDAVLLKPAGLDGRERSIIGMHPVIAGEILHGIEAMREIVPCILHHHERWDGRGYPHKLRADAIPLGARIIAVADTFDAMTTDRPYRRALSVELAREELLRGAGAQWDTACVEAFVALIDAGEVTPPPPAASEDDLARVFGQQVGV